MTEQPKSDAGSEAELSGEPSDEIQMSGESRDGVIAPGGYWLGQPKGLFLVSGVEFWERFSYYGMTGLLVLYLTATTQAGGLNWDQGTAIKYYGFYAGCAFAAPTLGGWISSRFLGDRSCILWGGVLVAVGHILLGGPVFFPELLHSLTNLDIYAVLHSSGAVLGKLSPSEADVVLLSQSLKQLTNSAGAGSIDTVILGYKLASWSLHVGLLFILIGTGLIKPCVSSIIGSLYPNNDAKREAGFSIFMAAIYLGAISANFTAGTLGEKVSWHYGFTVTALGMIVGVVVYLLRQHAYLAGLGQRVRRPKGSKAPKTPLSSTEKRRISALLIMGFGTVAYATAFYQKGGLLNLVTSEYVDRMIFGFEVPATWFLSISTFGFVLLAPFAAKLWSFLAARGIQVSVDRKLALGLASIAVGYIIISVGAASTGFESGTRISMVWMVATYLCFAVGDVLIWPPQLTAVATFAPNRYRSFAIGAWYLTIGFGTWMTGLVGSVAFILNIQSALLMLFAICVVAAVSMWLMHSRIQLLMTTSGD